MPEFTVKPTGSRPQIMGHHGVWPRRLLRLWQQYEAMGLEITLHHPDDEGQTEWDFTLPPWPWRWVCWIQGHHDSTYGYCVICHKPLRRARAPR